MLCSKIQKLGDIMRDRPTVGQCVTVTLNAVRQQGEIIQGTYFKDNLQNFL